MDQQRHSWALFALSCGVFMTAIDATVVNVALPVLGHEFHIGDSALVWIVNAYLSPLGGFLLLSGRLGDLLGRRRLFISGVLLFTLASLGCGVSTTPALLLVSRAAQGLAGAAIWTISMALVIDLFPDNQSRARALGVFAFVGAAGGSAGVLLGGVLTGLLSWHWIFYINVPVGAVVCYLCVRLIPPDAVRKSQERLDVAGALTITAALTLANLAVTDANQSGLLDFLPLISGPAAMGLALLFVVVESRASHPMIPTGLLRLRNFAAGNVAGALLSIAMLTWFFVSTLYLQSVLHLTPFKVGLSFLPSTLLDAAISIAVVPALIPRYGLRPLTITGLVSACLGLLWFARAPVDGSVLWDVIPPMLLLGFGTGMAYNPLLIASLRGVAPDRAGVVSGTLSASWTLGGTLGLTLLMRAATERTQSLNFSGVSAPIALNRGYQLSFAVAAMTVMVAALVSGFCLRAESEALSHEPA